jgi:replicative DNA helicase
MMDTGAPIDIVTITDWLKKHTHEGESEIRFSDLTAMMDNAFITSSQAVYGARKLKAYSTLRQTAALFSDALIRMPQTDDPTELLADIDTKIMDLISGVKNVRPTDVNGIMVETLTEMKENAERVEAGGTIGFDTGFKDLDEGLGGVIPTHVWVVGGYTGIGKSFWTNQVILNMLNGHKEARVLLFSTEMDRKSIMERLMGNIAGISALKLVKGMLTKEQYQAKQEAQEKMKEYQDRLFIYDNVWTLEELKLKTKKEKILHKVNVVFIDFIQNLRARGDIYERMSKSAIELQAMAKDLNMGVVILSQISNEGQKAGSDNSVISYKGAGELSAIADVALWIDSEKEPKQLLYKELIIKVRKARHAESGTQCWALLDGAGGGRMWQA